MIYPTTVRAVRQTGWCLSTRVEIPMAAREVIPGARLRGVKCLVIITDRNEPRQDVNPLGSRRTGRPMR